MKLSKDKKLLILFITLIIVIFVAFILNINTDNNTNDTQISDNDDYNKEKDKTIAKTCAIIVANKLKVSQYCKSFNEISDGFYNYNCSSIIIRIFKNNNSMTYDVYNTKSGTYINSGYCYNNGNNSNTNNTNNSNNTNNIDNNSNNSSNIDNNSNSSNSSNNTNNVISNNESNNTSTTEEQNTYEPYCSPEFTISKKYNTYDATQEITIWDKSDGGYCHYDHYINGEINKTGLVNLDIGDNIFTVEVVNNKGEKACKKVLIKRFEMNYDVPFTQLGQIEINDCN